MTRMNVVLFNKTFSYKHGKRKSHYFAIIFSVSINSFKNKNLLSSTIFIIIKSITIETLKEFQLIFLSLKLFNKFFNLYFYHANPFQYFLPFNIFQSIHRLYLYICTENSLKSIYDNFSLPCSQWKSMWFKRESSILFSRMGKDKRLENVWNVFSPFTQLTFKFIIKIMILWIK